uniref:Photosystem I assembly protein Ycf12 n=1 Tax=Prunus davidiana TaxID=151430 RepID=A0A6B9TUK8_9ROSA|nr:photosystem I assembly protein Ycf12 [Prunus davidiana]
MSLSISFIIGSSLTLVFSKGPRLSIDLLSLHLYSNSPLNNIEWNRHFSIELSCPYLHENTINE